MGSKGGRKGRMVKEDVSMDRVEPRFKGLPTSMDKEMVNKKRIREPGDHQRACHLCLHHHPQVGGAAAYHPHPQ